MEAPRTQGDPADARDGRAAQVAAAFRASAQVYRGMGSPLYAALCLRAADDPEIVELTSHGQEGASAMLLLSCVHYLLLRDPGDPLSRWFATLTDRPAPPEEAYPEFARFCRAHRSEILELLATRTVQTTFVERCRAVMPALSAVAARAGEPLNLVEIGCSAGVLLTFDKYAYDLGGGRVGPADAPLLLKGELRNGPPLRIPRIGARIGLDLHPIDVRSEDERRWVLALCFPEFREEQARLATALDVVAASDIRMLEGDALGLLPGVLAETPDPLCVFHSACLFYWSPQGKAALEALLLDASRDRDIWRVGLEPTDNFDSWHSGRAAAQGGSTRSVDATGDIVISHYRDGAVARRLVGHTSADYGVVDWVAAGD